MEAGNSVRPWQYQKQRAKKKKYSILILHYDAAGFVNYEYIFFKNEKKVRSEQVVPIYELFVHLQLMTKTENDQM